MTTAQEIQAMSEAETRAFTARLRRLAAEQGLRLVRSRCHDRRAWEYGRCMLVDARTNVIEFGGHNRRFDATIDRIAAYLEG